MDVMEAIHTRRSVRQYEDRKVPEDLLRQILDAAMMAPSACNAQPWHFVVIDDPQLLADISLFHPNVLMAAEAPVAVLVCGDVSLELSPGNWPVDCAAATENLLLAAHALGLGAVWTGVYPREERIDRFRQMLSLPEKIIPHALVPLGYPAEHPASEDRYREDRIHRNGWSKQQ